MEAEPLHHGESHRMRKKLIPICLAALRLLRHCPDTFDAPVRVGVHRMGTYCKIMPRARACNTVWKGRENCRSSNFSRRSESNFASRTELIIFPTRPLVANRSHLLLTTVRN